MNYLSQCVFLILIIIICLYYNVNSMSNQAQINEEKIESFTPGIRRIYRPYVRAARIFSEGFQKNSNNMFNKLLRKVGLY